MTVSVRRPRNERPSACDRPSRAELGVLPPLLLPRQHDEVSKGIEPNARCANPLQSCRLRQERAQRSRDRRRQHFQGRRPRHTLFDHQKSQYISQQPMSSINPVKKRKAARDPPLRGNDDPSTVVPANLSLADLDGLIDQRVTDAVGARISELSSRVDHLQRENQGLLLRCESLERSVQVLKREGNWTYSAPDVPRSHWIDQGHDEDYANGADLVVRLMKKSTQDLRSASSSEVVVRGVTTQSPILSDEVLCPHWEQLANAMQLSERIRKLNLCNVQLDEGTLQMIEASVRQKGVASLFLSDNQFLGGEGVQLAVDILKNNRTIDSFGWFRNSIHSTENACKLIDAVLEHPTISMLGFVRTFNEFVIPYTQLKRLFGGSGNDTLLKVVLSGIGVKTNGDRCIPDFLSTNPPLQWLDLSSNQLTDDDALHIGLALQSNTNLRILNLQKNTLAEKGKSAAYHQAIYGLNRTALSESMSMANLNTVSEANHTCEIVGIAPKGKAFMNDSNKSDKSNRSRKLFSLLRKRHRRGCNISQLESEFTENCIGLVPHVLTCVSTYSSASSGESSKQKCLSVIFKLVRGWKMPEMYQLRG